MTTATNFETTANIITANEIPGNKGLQWLLKCKFPWTVEPYEDSVYVEQSEFPEAPASGIYRVEVAFKSLKNKKEGGKHSGTHYWMNNYYMNKIVGPVDQMNPHPNNSTPWPGREEEAERNRAEFTGNTGDAPTPTANGNNGGHYDPSAPYNLYADRNYGQIKGNCNNILMALESKLPGMWDDDGNPNFAMWVYWRDEIYNNFQAIDITVYDQEVAEGGLVEEAKKLGAEAFLEGMANEPPPPPPAPAPEPETHYCERHKVEYSQEKDGAKRYYHQWNDNKHWCMEGDDSLRDAQGKPVTEATML